MSSSLRLYQETQYFTFTQIIAFVAFLFIVYKVWKHPSGFKKAIDRSVKTVSILVLGFVLVLIVTFRLNTEIYADRIAFGFESMFPGKPETIYFTEVREMAMVKRHKTDWGKKNDGPGIVSYTTSGQDAVEILKLDGKTVLIGTQDRDAISAVLKELSQSKFKGKDEINI